MKYFSILIIILVISCKSETEKRNPLKKYNPKTEIKQNIVNDTAISLYNEGIEKYQKMEYDSAIVYFQSSLKFEKNPITFNELGTTSATQRKYKEAIEYFKKGRELDPTYWPNYINESRTYLTLTEFDKGKYIINQMLQKCNSDFWTSCANYYMALMYFNDGLDCLKVKEHLDKAKGMKNDSKLKTQYEKFYKTYENNCG
ncbi:tetratricopeptide repeat protein [Lacinutrix sp. MEBiC02595]